MIPLNLIGKTGRADYAVTGNFSNLAYKEAQKYGQISLAASSEDRNHTYIPSQDQLKLDPEASYFYYLSLIHILPEKSHGAQHVLVGNGLHPLIGRARDGPQEVQRDGADLQLCQADRQVQAVLPALSHAQYAAGAHLQPRRPGPLDVGHLVLIGVCLSLIHI